MYSQQLQNYILLTSELADVPQERVNLLDDSMASYLQAFAGIIHADIDPPAELLSTTLNLLSLSMALADFDINADTDGSHYLVGMGLEQTGELLARHYLRDDSILSSPVDNDYWYRLMLALLHYMAGGYRVQALSTLRNLENISESSEGGIHQADYEQAMDAIQRLYSGKGASPPFTKWENLLFAEKIPNIYPGQRIFPIAEKIRNRHRVVLADLGQGREGDWLTNKGIDNGEAAHFWHLYLENLEHRGIISFTNEQIGPGFDHWLRPDYDLMVLLPTGSGKSIIGELRAGLTLAANKQVIWIMPTRSLVRQARRELSRAFQKLGVTVEELPTTDDFKPLFTELLNQNRLIAVTTPEKLAALIRTNPDAISNIGLTIIDEAQILFDLNRGTTAEFVLQEIQQRVPECNIILMSAVLDYLDRLSNFIHKLRGPDIVRELISDNKPTRIICGVITNTIVEETNTPIIQIYPPGIQRVDEETDYPISLTLSNQRLGKKSGPTAIAQSFLKSIASTNLRSVTFVNRLVSTETQADAVAKNINELTQLPEEDLARLHIELGRMSSIEAPSTKRIAPHHAGLTSLEQHIVEKWLRRRRINSVVATPTLAQGVNLPFDISILTYLKRMNMSTKQMESISHSEIVNMLGRAGRAGQVSDGVCLIALPTARNSTPTATLDSTRRYFFHMPEHLDDFLGLSRLMVIATNSGVSDRDWLYELSKMSLSEAQTLVSFSLNASKDSDDIRRSLIERLRLYPSIQDLEELWGEPFNVLEVLNSHAEPLVQNILVECRDDDSLLEAITKTGMPIEYLRSCLSAIQEDYDLRNRNKEYQIEWADRVVRNSLENCHSRQWFKTLFKDFTLEDIFPAIDLWRLGRPMVEIEQIWQYKPKEKQNRIYIGKFFNHTVSLLAQFWGALSILEELEFPEERNRPLENIQTFVREGVSTVAELEWLYQIGWIDRVLAHRLTQFTPDNLVNRERSRFIRGEFNRWRNNRNTIPIEMVGDELGALSSILDEMQ